MFLEKLQMMSLVFQNFANFSTQGIKRSSKFLPIFPNLIFRSRANVFILDVTWAKNLTSFVIFLEESKCANSFLKYIYIYYLWYTIAKIRPILRFRIPQIPHTFNLVKLSTVIYAKNKLPSIDFLDNGISLISVKYWFWCVHLNFHKH